MSISNPPFQSILVDADGRTQIPWVQWFSQLQPLLNSVNSSGPTSARPTSGLYIGYAYFDTTIDQMIYWNGATWVINAPSTSGTSILKGNGTGGFNNAISGVDFAPATTGAAILFGNNAGGFNSVAIGTGVTFVGGVLSATGTGGSVTAVTGISPILSSGGNTPAISIPVATTLVNGYLSAIDWTTFNNKGTVSSVAGTGAVNGITLTGTVTSSGSLTLGGSLSGVSLTTQVSGILPIANGGTNTATPALVAGTNVTISGIWPNQTINSTSPTSGTVTSVSGTGSVNGITLTGTVTSSGSLTLGGTLGGIGNSQLTNSSITINGSSVSLGGSTTVTATATNALTIGTGLSGTSYNGSTAVTIANTGVLSIAGTASQITASASTGAITLSLPQSINSGATPTFTGTNFTGIPNAGLTNSTITINGTATSLGGSISVGTVTAVSGTAPVVSSGGANPAISMAAATTTVPGYLTAADWTTFNNKQPAGAYLTASTGVTSFSGNSTGLTPASATTGAITLAGILVGANGGTGVANTGKTFTIGGNFTTSGAFTTTLTVTANTSLTLPVSGIVLSSVTAPTTNPITGTPSASNYLRGDGTWATIAVGSGTVTSVAATVPAFLSLAGSPITTSGTLAITLSGTALPVANGGTGITITPSNGQIPIGNGTNYTAATLTAGSGISVTNASGSITVANTQNTGPAFSAYANTSQTVTMNVLTKVALQVKEFDTASAFDSTTNYRFTPQVAGYYEVNAQLELVGTVTTVQAIVSVYKNGIAVSWGVNTNPSASLASNGYTNLSYSTLVYLNGSTDYIELYGYYFGGTVTFSTSNQYYSSRFSASMVRGA